MDRSKVTIDGPGSLRYFLALALKGEREQSGECERYPFFEGKNLDLLEEVSDTCDKHCNMLVKVDEKLKLMMENELESIGSFLESGQKGKMRKEVAEELLERAELLLDLYEKLRSRTDEALVSDACGDRDEDYFDIMDRLVTEEKKQVELIKRLIRRLTFLPSGTEL